MSFNFNPGLESRLDELRNKREGIENRIHERHQNNLKSNELFISNLKKELELLTAKKDQNDRRNEVYLAEKKKVLESYKKEMGKVHQADWIHQEERKKVNGVIEKNYPRYVHEVKQKLFQEQQDMDYKINELKKSSLNIVKMNEEIKKLSDQLHYKRLELIEEEERKMRTDNLLRKYIYSYPNPSPEGGQNTEKHFLSDSKDVVVQGLNINKDERTEVYNRGSFQPNIDRTEFNYGTSEFNTAIGQIKQQLNQNRQIAEETPAFTNKKDDYRFDQQNFSNAMSTIRKGQSQQPQQTSDLASTLKSTGGNQMKDSRTIGQSKNSN
eukprot:CAMPEP_0176448684 /NCGR_PEP_ID=MMETSP0127-20121128/25959_1 /TAXON_ID=938130 /ORGANISM="Platyophrya macrostoma, Strain WH" /LENGTH=323 /DNA_ID=CAMNT_0017835739 /DNA_START=12 /DNA_END=983 /DNA_ORIENTATION=-